MLLARLPPREAARCAAGTIAGDVASVRLRRTRIAKAAQRSRRPTRHASCGVHAQCSSGVHAQCSSGVHAQCSSGVHAQSSGLCLAPYQSISLGQRPNDVPPARDYANAATERRSSPRTSRTRHDLRFADVSLARAISLGQRPKDVPPARDCAEAATERRSSPRTSRPRHDLRFADVSLAHATSPMQRPNDAPLH
jgi:hypothetical protein